MPALPGSVAWYATGRFYRSTDGTVQDLGYFLYLQGVEDMFADAKRTEGSALLTFRSAPFRSSSINNGSLALDIDEPGEFSVWLRDSPGARWRDPASFSTGKRVGMFRRNGIVVGATVGHPSPPGGPGLLTTNVFTASLVWSAPFQLGGSTYDLSDLLPQGVTQWGTCATTAGETLPGYDLIVPFLGSAVVVGGPAPTAPPSGARR